MPKAFRHPGNGKARKHIRPETADDWVRQAVDLEDSGDRWIQDPTKAHRFYIQSIAAYDQALALDQTSFDAAYNRARVLLQISQVCALLAVPRLETIRQAVMAHRNLLLQCPSNCDVQYNFSIALMLYAEIVSNHKVLTAHQADGSVSKVLSEAFENLSQCLVKQNDQLAEIQSSASKQKSFTIDNQPNDSDTISGEEQMEEMEVTYISNDSIFDTLISILECYNQFLELEDTPTAITVVEAAKTYIMSSVLPQVQQIMPLCMEQDAQQRLAEVQYAIELSQLEFDNRLKRTFLQEWSMHLGKLAANATSVPMLCASADAYKDLASTMASVETNPAEIWIILTSGAYSQITKAIEIMQSEKRKAPSLFIAKADIELLRANLKCASATRNYSTLLQNASVYYNRAVADCLPKDIRLKNEAALKLAIVHGQLNNALPAVPEMTKEEASQIIADVRDDGLFEGTWEVLDNN